MLISYASVIHIRSQFLTEEEAVPQAPVMCGKYPSPHWLALSLPPLPFRRCKQYASPAAVKQHSSCSMRWSSGYYWGASSAPHAWAGTAPYGHTELLAWLTRPTLALAHNILAKKSQPGMKVMKVWSPVIDKDRKERDIIMFGELETVKQDANIH